MSFVQMFCFSPVPAEPGSVPEQEVTGPMRGSAHENAIPHQGTGEPGSGLSPGSPETLRS